MFDRILIVNVRGSTSNRKRSKNQKTFFDFGIAKENRKVQRDNLILEKAIAEEKLVTFSYRDAKGQETQRLVQPLAIQYKWYSWYLFAWSVPQEAYRTFKRCQEKREDKMDE